MSQKTKTLSGKDIKELEKEAFALREEIARISIEVKVNKPKNTNEITQKKKQLAIVLTIISAKKKTVVS